MKREIKDERIQLRIHSDLKQKAQEYCDRHGIDLSELIERFLRRIVNNEKERMRERST